MLPPQIVRLALEKDRRQIPARRFLVKAHGHQCHRLDDSQSIPQAPTEQSRVPFDLRSDTCTTTSPRLSIKPDWLKLSASVSLTLRQGNETLENLGHNGNEKENADDYQMHQALQHSGARRPERDH